MKTQRGSIQVQTSALRALLNRPVAFQPVLARLCGSVTAGLMLSQAIYWSERTQDGSGWFYKTQVEWTEEICLSKSEQQTARKILSKLGFMRSELRGLPAKVYYLVDIERVCEAISRGAENKNPRLPKSGNQVGGHTSSKKTSQPDDRKAANLPADIPQTFNAESTAETTSVLTPNGEAMKEWVAAKDSLKDVLTPKEWSLWVAPARLLKIVAGGFLIALPPNRRILEAAKARVPELRKVLGRPVAITKYPDDHDRARLEKEFPEFYAQMLGT